MVNISGYEFIEQIGSGGMAAVWKARQLSLDRIVAVKILGKSSLPDQEARDRFKKEAQIAAKLNHPSIVQVYDAGEVGDEAYLVMEYVDGHTAADEILQQAVLSEARSLEIAASVAKALAYAWEKDCLIHCDIKPDNILIDRTSGAIKLADLGLARMVGFSVRRDEEAYIFGTPNYMAPEQSEGLADLDCRTDMYALGATLYHMVTGMLPFREIPNQAGAQRAETGFLEDPQTINPALSAPAAWLIEKLMIKDRALRPHFWTQVLKDLDQVQQGKMPFDPLPEPGASSVGRASKRTKSTSSSNTPAQGMKLKIKKPDMAPIPAPKPSASRGGKWSSALVSILIIGGVGLAVAHFNGIPITDILAKLESRWMPPEPAGLPPTETEAEQTAAIPEIDQPAPETKSPWQSDDFKAGARLFNEALASYNDYQKTRQNPENLSSIEAKCREAIGYFEKCRDTAPPTISIDTYVSQCYGLISGLRQTMTMDKVNVTLPATSDSTSGSKPKITVVEDEAVTEPPKIVFIDDEPEPPAPEPTPEPKNLVALTLDKDWRNIPADASGLGQELSGLITRFAPSEPTLMVDSATVLFPGIHAMMTAFEAGRVLQQELPIKRTLSAPGFPANSLYFYEFEGNFSGARQLTLVVDRNNRVVMVQLFDDKELPARLEPGLFSPRWRIYDFLRMRQRTGAEGLIAHRSREKDQLIRIDTEMAAANAGANGEKLVIARAQLLMPKAVAGLIVEAAR